MTTLTAMRPGFLRFADSLASAAGFLVRLLMVAITAVVLAGVFFRYVVQDALVWTEEAARYLMIWMGFVGSGLALREGGHIAIEMLRERIPGSARPLLLAVVRLLSLAFLVGVLVIGVSLLLRIRGQSSPALGIPMIWPYLAVPVGCGLMAIEVIAAIVRDLETTRRDDSMHETQRPEPC